MKRTYIEAGNVPAAWLNHNFPRRLSNYSISVDFGQPGGDKTVRTLFKRPGWFRRLMRRWKVDRSTWEYKIISSEVIEHGNR